MTTLNEAESLPQFLRSIETQSRLPTELVIVDGGSTDNTKEILSEWSPPTGLRLVFRETPGLNIAQGRNVAVENTDTELLLVADGGTQLSPRWCEELVSALERGADVASGFFEPMGSSPLQRAIGAVITPLRSEIRSDRFLPSSRSLGFKKGVGRAAGLYPENLTYCEDLVFDLAMKSQGAKFVFVPDAVARWNSRPNLHAYFRQYRNYARGDRRAGLWRKRHIVRLGAYVLAAGLAIASARHKRCLVLLALGTSLHLWKPFRRVLGRAKQLRNEVPAALLLTPAIVLVGDLAKVLGYWIDRDCLPQPPSCASGESSCAPCRQ
ncbi:glycosyltransferase [Acidipropionibacterium jensenii]|uniref:glycosyltransferase n=1 Tax=Acidipropionibacterium jensenii TaxID=1749 RepID=UPI0035A2A088